MGEAVRLERQTPPSVDRGQMERLLNVMTRHDLEVCLHSKPLKSANHLKNETKRQKNLLDTIAPYFGKNSAPPGPKSVASTSNSRNAAPVDAT